MSERTRDTHGSNASHDEGGVSGFALRPAAGHNEAARVAQWQTPHHDDHDHGDPASGPEPDFDLVEAAFAEGFPKASDATSFLRLARIPFVARHADGRVLRLLRVEYEEATDVGSLTPHVGGETLRYDPLPSQMVSTRKRLRFVYQDGTGVAHLSLGEVRGLIEDTDA